MILLGPLPAAVAATLLASAALLFTLTGIRLSSDKSEGLAFAGLAFFGALLVLAEASFVFGYSFWLNFAGVVCVGAVSLALSKSHESRSDWLNLVVRAALVIALFRMCRPWIEDSSVRGAIHVDVLAYALPETVGLLRWGLDSVIGAFPHYFYGWEVIGAYFFAPSTAQVFGTLALIPAISFAIVAIPSSNRFAAVIVALMVAGFVHYFVKQFNPFTKNDLAVGAFLGSGLVLCLRHASAGDRLSLAFGAISLTLAAACKPTALIVGIPVLVAMLMTCRSRAAVATAGAVAGLVLAPWLWRYARLHDISPEIAAAATSRAFWRMLPDVLSHPMHVDIGVWPLVNLAAWLLAFVGLDAASRWFGERRRFKERAVIYAALAGGVVSLLLAPYVAVRVSDTTIYLQFRLAYPLAFTILVAWIWLASTRLPGYGGASHSRITEVLAVAASGIGACWIAFLIAIVNPDRKPLMTGSDYSTRGTPTDVYKWFVGVRDSTVFGVSLIPGGLLGDGMSNHVRAASFEEIRKMEKLSAADLEANLASRLDGYDYVAVAKTRNEKFGRAIFELVRTGRLRELIAYDDDEAVVLTRRPHATH